MRYEFPSVDGFFVLKGKIMNKKIEIITSIVLVFAVALSRLFPHPLNFTPIGAIALFAGVNFSKKYSLLLPIIAMLVSDYFLGFYSTMYWVYSSLILMSVVGILIKEKKSIPIIIGATLLNSILFFVITNFGVWFGGVMYPQSFSGLVDCYIAAIPFFRNSITGDLFYVAVIFGLFEVSKILIKNLKLESSN